MLGNIKYVAIPLILTACGGGGGTTLHQVIEPTTPPHLICIGDSTTNRGISKNAIHGDPCELLAGKIGATFENLGRGGYTTAEVQAHVADHPLEANYALISVGRNDILTEADRVKTIERTRELIARLKVDRFVIWPVWAADSEKEYCGTDLDQWRVMVNAARWSEWPDSYLPLEDNFAAAADGTVEDTFDVANCLVPGSLRADVVHLNRAGNDVAISATADFILRR